MVKIQLNISGIRLSLINSPLTNQSVSNCPKNNKVTETNLTNYLMRLWQKITKQNVKGNNLLMRMLNALNITNATGSV